MPDTHDERGPFRNDLRSELVAAGTEAAEQWLTVRANRKMSDVNRRRLAGHVVNALWAEIETAVLEMAPYFGDEQLAAARARAEKAEALAYRVVGAIECTYALNTFVELEPGEKAPTVESLWAEVREIRGLAADAAPDGRSATETGGDDVQGSDSVSTPVRASAGLSERCRATKLDDGIRHHCDNDSGDPHTHECGDCAHRWDDNTTEDSGA